jgi:hypothetical protein
MQKIQTTMFWTVLHQVAINDEHIEPDFNDEQFLGHSILD